MLFRVFPRFVCISCQITFSWGITVSHNRPGFNNRFKNLRTLNSLVGLLVVSFQASWCLKENTWQMLCIKDDNNASQSERHWNVFVHKITLIHSGESITNAVTVEPPEHLKKRFNRLQIIPSTWTFQLKVVPISSTNYRRKRKVSINLWVETDDKRLKHFLFCITMVCLDNLPKTLKEWILPSLLRFTSLTTSPTFQMYW